ncbi:hypothetical protein EVAR_23121_1 [Eumeta japonica]|uniref:Uncharacterized protein n=1 Tax=Eumeta variegata TaxID=151549 RepID=A0A4C1VC50_EUMVA|nr:hypothetical protein EVAR_23121_1 [Eumeta japonica]
MVTIDLERIKFGELQNSSVKDEYVERLKDSLRITFERLELDELWKVTKSVLIDEAKKVYRVNKKTDVSKKDNEWLNFEMMIVVAEKKKKQQDLLFTMLNCRLKKKGQFER